MEALEGEAWESRALITLQPSGTSPQLARALTQVQAVWIRSCNSIL